LTEPALRDISDTARWVAFYRAMESERPDALFRDPHARRLAGPRGEEIVRTMPRGRATAWPMIVRTAVFDEILLRLVEREGVEAVLNLAAGLDARPYRLPLPASLRWIEVDLPAIIEYKEEILAGETPACTVERVRLDLADAVARRDLFARIAAERRRVLVVSEGLLVYLGEDEVASLASDLCLAGFRWWLTDLASPVLLKMIRKSWGPKLSAAKAPFRFGPQSGADFFRPFGWRPVEIRSTWEESQRLDRQPPMAWLYRLMAKLAPRKKRESFRTMSSYVLLENAAA
jgi:methyltransferase (TIGR00027 family)